MLRFFEIMPSISFALCPFRIEQAKRDVIPDAVDRRKPIRVIGIASHRGSCRSLPV